MSREWVMHGNHGLGWIVERLPARTLVIQTDEGEQTVTRGYRYLDSNSLEVLAATNKAAFRSQLDSHLLLADSLLLGVESFELKRLPSVLRPLGVDPEQIESLVRQMETQLEGSKFCVEDGVLTRRSESLSDSEFGKQVASEGLDWLKSATDLTNAQETVRQAVIAEWSVDLLEEVMGLSAVLQKVIASSSDSSDLLAALYLGANSTSISKAAVARLRSISDLPREAVQARLVHFEELLQREARWGREEWSAATVAVERLLGDQEWSSCDVLPIALRIAARERAPKRSKDLLKVHAKLDRVIEVSPHRDGDFEKVFDSVSPLLDWPSAALLGSSLDLVAGGFRAQWLTSIAKASPTIEAGVDGLFEGISVSDLRRLTADAADSAEGVLDSGCFSTALKGVATQALSRPSPAVVGDLLGLPTLSKLVSADRLARVVTEVWGATAHGEAVLTEIGRPMVVAKGSELEAAMSELRSRFEAASADAEKEIAAMHAHVEQAEGRLEAAEELLRLGSSEVRQASQGELRQRWLDGVQIAIEIVEEVRRGAEAGRIDGAIHDRLRAVLEANQVEVVGEVAEGRELFRRGGATGPVRDERVVEPAYVTRRFGDVTVIREGMTTASE